MKRLIAATALFALAAPAAAQTSTVQQAADDLAGAVNRITALEARVSALEQGHAVQPSSGKRDYASAYALAVAKNVPLVVWSSGVNPETICASCIEETDVSAGGDFVHVVTHIPGLPNDAIGVGVPEGGEVAWVGTVTQWQTGSVTNGHIPRPSELAGEPHQIAPNDAGRVRPGDGVPVDGLRRGPAGDVLRRRDDGGRRRGLRVVRQ
jgi:hypothetical protein